MDFKTGLFLIALAIGCAALPTQPEDDMSIFFEQTDPTGRIVGGTEAPAGSHPHIVAITNGALIRSFLCGGSIVGPRHVLTAAHCIAAVFSWGSLSSSLRVTVGTNRWNQGGTTLGLARNITHSHYVAATIKNDIGFLITSTDIPISALVSLIPINYNEIGGGEPVRVAGWGRIRNGGSLSANLLEIFLWTIPGDQCVTEVAQASVNFNVRAPPVEPHIEICTFHSANVGTCNGDSGSPLVQISSGAQIGVVSWGFPCARGAPDVFARISGFADFIRQALA